MRQPYFSLCAAAVSAAALSDPLLAQEPVTVETEFIGADGESHGRATLTQTPAGVLIRAELSGLPEGVLGMHIHERGVCEAPFESAGAHYNPSDAPHGFLAEGGPEAGDLPNIHVPATGALVVEVFNPNLSIETGADASLVDGEGTALMIHDHHDDYVTQPAGDAGGRIACAVIAP